MTGKYSSKKNHRSDYRERYEEEYDEDDDDDSYRVNTLENNRSRDRDNKFDIIGEAVSIKSNRKEVYHDSEGRRVYGSWK